MMPQPCVHVRIKCPRRVCEPVSDFDEVGWVVREGFAQTT